MRVLEESVWYVPDSSTVCPAISVRLGRFAVLGFFDLAEFFGILAFPRVVQDSAYPMAAGSPLKVYPYIQS